MKKGIRYITVADEFQIIYFYEKNWFLKILCYNALFYKKLLCVIRCGGVMGKYAAGGELKPPTTG
jgi:hypothetical protein